MRLVPRAIASALLIAALGTCGCLRPSRSQLDEEKEPHFLAGKSRTAALDYQGALESFEAALENNPRSASAHFEAGLLYEKYKQDNAAAIFHFQRFLELRPRSEYAELVRQRILACKQELAKTVSLGPVTQSLQREFERLTEENKRLKEQVESWRAYATALRNYTNSLAQQVLTSAAVLTPTSVPSTQTSFSVSPTNIARNGHANSISSRSHTVKSGDTPVGIARKYNVRVEALMAANPKVDARRLRVGQSLNIPMQ
jgi:LysM repeat protein